MSRISTSIGVRGGKIVAIGDLSQASAGEVFDAREKLRAAGRESALNVLDSENELNAARINFTSAYYDSKEAAYRLLLAMGVLTPGLLGLP